MSNASDWLENQIIDHIFRTATFAKPTALWVALCTSAPTDAGGGTEVVGGSYARVNLPPLNTNWTATQGGTAGASSGTGGVTANAVTIQFAAPTADWGTVTHFKLMDQNAGGNMLIWGVITAPQNIVNGAPAPKFDAGTLVITQG
ncbi:MAG TPA: hypothetical protein PKV98_04605 [Burkholderiaceae bacterium]|nr:hypothetical protein [Burkholderiaceae bacterium]